MFDKLVNVAVFGSSSSVGKEFINYFLSTNNINQIFLFS
jgi:hypothetical protein